MISADDSATMGAGESNALSFGHVNRKFTLS
jgi:hypothetical protein